MRLLFISDVGSVHARRWASEMIRRGHEVVFLSVRPGELEGATVIYRDPGDLPAPKWLKLLRHLRFIIRECWYFWFGGFDVIHVHYLRADAIAWAASWHPRSVISVWGSDVRLVEEGGDPRHLGLRRRALEKAALVTATNQFLADRVRKLAPDAKRIEIIPFGVDLSCFDRSRWVPPRRGVQMNAPDVIASKAKQSPRAHAQLNALEEVRFLSIKPRLLPTYGPDLAIRALAIVIRDFPSAKLTLVGSGDPAYKKELMDLAEELGISRRMVFLESVAHAEVPSLFAHTDVLVQSSRWESFGVVILEAAAMGVPAIATNVGGVSDIVVTGRRDVQFIRLGGLNAPDVIASEAKQSPFIPVQPNAPDTGVIVPAENVDALAEAMLILARDTEFRLRLGQNAYQMVISRYDFQKNADRMETLYREMVKGKPA
jgi:glycosyltransferase involved in cell wall biosynthesis